MTGLDMRSFLVTVPIRLPSVIPASGNRQVSGTVPHFALSIASSIIVHRPTTAAPHHVLRKHGHISVVTPRSFDSFPLMVPVIHGRCLSWSAGLLWRRKEVVSSDTEDDDNNGGSRTPPSVAAAECYACTQPGAPAFHSTTCDRAHSPEWEASAGSSLIPIRPSQTNVLRSLRPGKSGASLIGGQVLDPRSEKVRRWNRLILLARAVAVAVDPLFFYVLSIGRRGVPCLYMDGSLLAIVTALRTAADGVHLVHVWLQFRVAYVSRESLVVGCGKLVWDARLIAAHYLRSLRGFWFDVFVILPVPQFLPKVYHSICVMRRMQKVTGYIFGTIWWGFGLNLIAYFIASHVAGGCWYVLAIQRVASCLQQQCERKKDCDLVSLACSKEVCNSFTLRSRMDTSACEGNLMASIGMQNTSVCLIGNGPFPYGIYNWALPVVSSSSLAVKILYPIFWGLMTLSTFGNDLEPTSHWLEVIFSIVIVLSGLMLFTLLIGNIQVPLFHNLDDLILDNICERVKPLVFSKGEKVIREGDAVQRMVFVVRGHLKSSQCLSKGIVATCMLGPGNFLGDELLSWCLRRPFVDRLPASSATFECVEPAEAFGLDAPDLRYITEHFRYKFANERLKRTARFYSSNWQTWAAVNIQLAWRRYKTRTGGAANGPPEQRDGERRLRMYAAMFMSLRPQDHLE
ncbi:hypothetical protein GW17_00005707 [Ensete ventricosum]|nr:hypothetical protein GW17_00005707 [Ensete ventricosum]